MPKVVFIGHYTPFPIKQKKGLSHQKQLLPYGRDSCFAWNRCHNFMKKAWYLWHESQTTCVLLLNFRTFMETPFALNSLPLRQRTRWRIRSQVSWRKTCKPSALYTIGIHAFFINLRNTIPLQIHESPPFATPDAKSCFCIPRLLHNKRTAKEAKEKSRTFLQAP